ncbi:MAG TPA: DUF1223 domain-containing protein [Terriglobales bacterium]|nr:DUF1223 domain-containing protein [Terriglobales bacterium]
MSKPMRSVLPAIFVGSLLFVGAAVAGSERPQDGDQSVTSIPAHPVLVELFTSEGCSSCPPADALLQKLDSVQPIPGAQLIVLSEHVDYWDHDGWKDANSSSLLTERQEAYVHALGLSTAYTPQFIVDGSSEVRANNPTQANDIFNRAAAQLKAPVSIGEVAADPANPTVLRVRIVANGSSTEHSADIYVAVALDHVESQVLHGENGGKRLTHTAVVQQLTKVGKLPKNGSFDEVVQLKLKPGTDLKNIRLIAFVQESGPGKVVGSALRKPAS